MTEIGLKAGSLNTVFAYRDESGRIEIKHKTTYVRYPFDTLHNKSLPPVVGADAEDYADSEQPLNLGVIEKEEGIRHTKDILLAFEIPTECSIVVAAPAVEISDGRNRLRQVINEVVNPKEAWLMSEGLCSAVEIIKDTSKVINSTFFCLNLGSSTTEFGCFSEGKNAHLSAHSELSGNRIDEIIRNKVCNSVGGAMVSIKEIRNIKESASLIENKNFLITGKTRDGIEEKYVSDEVISPLNEYINGVAEMTKREILSNVPTDIARIAIKHSTMPLIISGGMSNVEGLPEALCKAISQKMNHEFTFASPKDKEGHISPAKGALLLCEEIVKEE